MLTLDNTSKETSSAQISDRRIGSTPVPESLDLYLNDEQQTAVVTMGYFGWELVFVRRSDLHNILHVLQNTQTREYAVLDIEGSIIRSPNIKIR